MAQPMRTTVTCPDLMYGQRFSHMTDIACPSCKLHLPYAISGDIVTLFHTAVFCRLPASLECCARSFVRLFHIVRTTRCIVSLLATVEPVYHHDRPDAQSPGFRRFLLLQCIADLSPVLHLFASGLAIILFLACVGAPLLWTRYFLFSIEMLRLPIFCRSSLSVLG